MEPNDGLKPSGIAVLDKIEQALIENLRQYYDSPNPWQRQYQRQTELEWQFDCEAVFRYFEQASIVHETSSDLRLNKH